MKTIKGLGLAMVLPVFMGACGTVEQAGLSYQPMTVTESEERIVIANAPGGSLRQHAVEVDKARRSGRQVVLAGQYCLSACTMYLGLANVCVMPETIFGFHGPRRPSNPNEMMQGEEHKTWTYYTAGYYPKALAMDYISTYSNEISGFHYFTGAELNAKYGIALCK